MNTNDVCMRLVEYSKNGRTFRKWTYERYGEKVNAAPCCRHCHHRQSSSSVRQDLHTARESESEARRPGRRRCETSPLARRLKQQRIQRREDIELQKEDEERQSSPVPMEENMDVVKQSKSDDEKVSDESRASSYNDLRYQKDKFRIRPQENRTSAEEIEGTKRKPKEKSELNIDEGAALKEMSKLYQDLLERFEELKQKQESQMRAEADGTRLRRLAKEDPSVKETLQEVIDYIKKALQDFKTCATLAGSLLPNAMVHERELGHILLELECTAILD